MGVRNSTAFGDALNRTSNTFKTLVDNRAKTPNRFGTQGIANMGSDSKQRLNDSNILRSSGSTHSLLNGMTKMKESKCSRLSESRSFEQLLNTP